MENNLKLSDMEMDALREMGNVGFGNVTTDLSKLINMSVDMHIPVTKFIPVKDFSKEFGDPEAIVSGIYLKITGDLEGEAMFVFPEAGALRLVDIMLGKEIGTTKKFDEMDLSAFKELSNILTGSFLNSISKMLDVKLLPSVPHVATDMMQAIVDYILIKIGEHADDILCIKTNLNVKGHEIGGEFFVLYNHESLAKMVEILHTKYGLN